MHCLHDNFVGAHKDSKSLSVLAAYLKLIVGLGSHTRQKSAIRAMITLAKTKSSSLLKFSPLLVYSAVPLAAIPMPICKYILCSGQRLVHDNLVYQVHQHSQLLVAYLTL